MKGSKQEFPPFDLTRLLKTVFEPRQGEVICILIDLESPTDIKDLSFLKKPGHEVQKKAFTVFYQGLKDKTMQKLGISRCDLYAYQTTGGSNLELPDEAISPSGNIVHLSKDIYPQYDIILCLTKYSATAPLTAAAKEYGFRGATLHGLNDAILNTGLAVDYNEVSRKAEQLRSGMTHAESVDIDFAVKGKSYHLHIDLGHQEAQKSHGICHEGKDIVNLPAGEVYFVPTNAHGEFPIKFEEDGTIGLMKVVDGRVVEIKLIQGNQDIIETRQALLKLDPATGILGELGFGTQELPYSGADIQDEKIFGTFHIATGRNDHLNGTVTKELFINLRNATHDDILFSSTKTPEIEVKRVKMKRKGREETLIENYEPSSYLKNLEKSETIRL